ncbi:MAG: hypothetical protein O7A04_07690 [Acidobacteria bacterium]|nr:hypothetical protein [Acidobacteriota bacterium]
MPVFLLAVQIFWVHQDLVEGHRVRPIRVPDTASYLRLARMSTIDGALSHYRSNGYPLLLRIFTWREIAGPELWVFFCGVLALFAGTWAYTQRAWLGLAAASPLLYGDTLKLLGRVQPDFVACGLVLLSVSWLLLLIARPRNVLLWILLVLSVFASYQVRPATLFLIGWLPVMGWALKALRERTSSRATLVWAGGLATAVVVPYLMFAGWRYARIGEFGLVAFGGYNMSGLAASLIDDEMLDELDEPHQWAARRILMKRQRRGWSPYRAGEGSLEWFEQYSENIWRVSVWTAKDQLLSGREVARARGEEIGQSLHVAVNRYLRSLSRDVIQRRLGKYVRWVRDANLFGWKKLGGSPWVIWPAGLLLVTVLGLWTARQAGLWSAVALEAMAPQLLGMLLLGVTFFLAYIFLVSLLSYPFTRYYYGTVLLLPSALCVVLAALWGEVLGALWMRRRAVVEP